MTSTLNPLFRIERAIPERGERLSLTSLEAIACPRDIIDDSHAPAAAASRCLKYHHGALRQCREKVVEIRLVRERSGTLGDRHFHLLARAAL